MKIGDRVLYKPDGGIGHIEAIDLDDSEMPCVDVRWLTPNNEPSVLTSCVLMDQLVHVGENVVPQPRSKEWWDEAREFCAGVEGAVMEMLQEEGGE
jgi:hypothetical protein